MKTAMSEIAKESVTLKQTKKKREKKKSPANAFVAVENEASKSKLDQRSSWYP